MARDKQWRPYPRGFVEHPNALSRALVQGLPDAINNYIAYVQNPRAWCQAFMPAVKTVVVNSAAQLVTCPFPPVPIPATFDKFAVQMRARRISGSGAVSLRIYLCDTMYLGPGTFSTDDLDNFWYIQMPSISDTNWDIKQAFNSIQYPHRDPSGRLWLLFTSYTTDSGQAEISNLDITTTTYGSWV